MSLPCVYCHGTGFDPNSERISTCLHCGGSGKQPNTDYNSNRISLPNSAGLRSSSARATTPEEVKRNIKVIIVLFFSCYAAWISIRNAQQPAVSISMLFLTGAVTTLILRIKIVDRIVGILAAILRISVHLAAWMVAALLILGVIGAFSGR